MIHGKNGVEILFLGLLLVFGFLGNTVKAGTDEKTKPEDMKMEKAFLAGGCFWCMESDFEKIEGVKEVISGYTGGTGKNPTYGDYAQKGHIEAVRIVYDPSRITYQHLLALYWVRIDPEDGGGQFCDRGHAYTSAIFYQSEAQKKMAQQSKEILDRSGLLKKSVATQILPLDQFYPAEAYHQQYYKKHPLKYRFYRFNCGRDRRLKKIWSNAGNLTEVMRK